LLAGVLLLALLLRVAALISYQGSIYADYLTADERTYDGWARSLLYGIPHYIYSLSALPAYVLAVVYQASPNPLYGRLLNVFFGVGTCAFVYGIGRVLAGRAVGLAAALLAAAYRDFVFFSVTLLKEPLGLLLFSALIYLSVSEWRQPRHWRAIAIGIVAGLLLNVRQNAGAVLVILGPALVWRGFQERRSHAVAVATAILLTGAFLAPSLPFLIANYRGTGRISPVSLGGFDLYLGNHLDGKRPFYNAVPFASSAPDTQGIEFTIEASRRTGRWLTLGEGSDYWIGEVARTAASHPFGLARKLLQKALAVFNRWEEADNHDIGFVSQAIPFFRLPLIPFWLVMPLGMAGLLVSVRGDRRAALLMALVFAYIASMVVVFSNMRIRAPLLVVMFPFAAIGVRWFLDGGAGASLRRVTYSLLTLAFVVVEAIPIDGSGDLTAHYNGNAVALMQSGRSDEAVRMWEASANANGAYSDTGRVALASWILTLGDSASARSWLDRVPDDSVAAATKYEVVGQVLQAEGRLPEAAAALERSIDIAWGEPRTRRRLIELYRVVSPERVAPAEEELAHILGYYGSLAPPLPPDRVGRASATPDALH
jgi:tetratricopeptide (TPR) repeat protein